MFLVDANVLLYAVDSDSEWHGRSLAWLDEAIAGTDESVGLPWPSLLAFVRIATNPRIYRTPLSAIDAWDHVEKWLAQPAVWIPSPGPRHRQILGELIRRMHPTANLIPDVHLAALATEYGLTVVSADTDFAKFRDLRWLDPLDR
jgi:toxin-antitoxin system PIN domain toxin